jgi:hypothetical protein
MKSSKPMASRSILLDGLLENPSSIHSRSNGFSHDSCGRNIRVGLLDGFNYPLVTHITMENHHV